MPNPSQMEAIHDEFGRFQSDRWRETYAIDGAAESVESRSVYALYTLRDGFPKRYDYGSFNEDEVAQYAMDGQIVEFVYDPVLFAPSFSWFLGTIHIHARPIILSYNRMDSKLWIQW